MNLNSYPKGFQHKCRQNLFSSTVENSNKEIVKEILKLRKLIDPSIVNISCLK